MPRKSPLDPAGHLRRHAFGIAFHDERERARPERVGERARNVGHIGCERFQLFTARDVDDNRMVGRTALHREQLLHRARVRRVRAQAVDRLGRERDELSGAQRIRGARNVRRYQ